MSVPAWGPIGASFEETLGLDIVGFDPSEIPTESDSESSENFVTREVSDSDEAEADDSMIREVSNSDEAKEDEDSERDNNVDESCSCHRCVASGATAPLATNPSNHPVERKIDLVTGSTHVDTQHISQ